MKKRTTHRIFASLLATILIFALLPSSAMAVTQEEIDELRAERMAIAEEHDKKQAEIDELEEQKASVLERKLAMDERNELTRQEIESIQSEILVYDQMIAAEAIKVEEARFIEEQQLERYRARVRAMEENGEISILALVLRARDLNELLTAIDDASRIMQSDKALYENYITARENTEAVKAQYIETKTELQGVQDELREEQAALEAEIEEATRMIQDLEADIVAREEEAHALLLAEIETAERLDALIAEQERQRAEEEERRRQQEAANNAANGGGGDSGGGGGGSSGGTVTGSGSFAWPCPGCTYVTSRAGNRFHPIFNEWRYHSGMDIGAGYGSSVVASDSGTVILADVNGGYGNCIMIDHGNGYYTLYGHLSGYAVSYGQSVSQGQTIGYVGDTGWATGPHLHFEIRQGSTCLDPEAVAGFSGLTYAPDAGN